MAHDPENAGRKAAEAAVAAGYPKWAELAGTTDTGEAMIDPGTGLPIISATAPPGKVEEQKLFIAGHNAVILEALADGRITKTFAGRWHSKDELIGAVVRDDAHEIGLQPLAVDGPVRCVFRVPPRKPRAKRYDPMVICEYESGEIRTVMPYYEPPLHFALIDDGRTVVFHSGMVVFSCDVETLTRLNRYAVTP